MMCKQKLKIAQIITSSGNGGAEKVFIDLCNNLSERYSITAYTYDNPYIINGLSKAVKIYLLDQKSRYHLPSYLKLYRSLKRAHIDIVHTHSAKASFIFYHLNKILRLPHLATKHNSRKGKIFNKIRDVTAVSKRVARSISHPASIIYNGINPIPIDKHAKESLCFKLLSVGRLDSIKGFGHLIQEVSKLQINYHLEIIGDGPQRAELEKLIKVLKLEGKVSLLGYLKNIPEKMAESDLVVINSLSEGFSIVALEALYYSKVLISTKVGVIDEILNEELLFEHNDLAHKIEEIQREYPYYRQAFEQIRRQNNDRFLFSKTVDAYESAYNKLLK